MSDSMNVKLGEYKGLKMKSQPVTIKPFEIDSVIEEVLENASRVNSITDRPVAEGDTILLDFAGSIDGVPFDGGTAQNYELVVGSHSFIDNFEDQLVGAEIGKMVDVHVTFPANYGSVELAGKPALFRCKVNAIHEKIVPEFNDAFCKEHLNCDTEEAFRAHVEQQLLEQKMQQMQEARVQGLVARVVETSEAEVPEALIEAQMTARINDFASTLMQQGLELEQYCEMTGLTMDTMKAQLRPGIVNGVKTQMVLYAIAEREGITVDDEEIDRKLAAFAAKYGMDPEELKKQLGEEELGNLKAESLLNKAAEVIVQNAVEE